MKIFILFFSFFIIPFFNSQNVKKENNKNIIHFIKCGYDSILIESNGKFGLIDASNNYKYIKNEVEKLQINMFEGEQNNWSKKPEESVQAVLDYLESLQVKKLDFIVATHSHNDHIGGIPAIAYKYVDNSTIYYYRTYTQNLEDIIRVFWSNKKYYLAAVNSMAKKNAKLVEVSNKKIKFDFGDMNIELLNTEIAENNSWIRENKNSIGTLIKFKNTKIFLAADIVKKDDKKIKDYLGKIDILKLSHHGFSETSLEFLKATRPDHIIITSSKLYNHAINLIKHIKIRYNSKIYITQFIKDKSIRVNLDLNGYQIEDQKNAEFILHQILKFNIFDLVIIFIFAVLLLYNIASRKMEINKKYSPNKTNNNKNDIFRIS